METLRRRVSFFGRVQGVGFRATARDTARSFAVTGWVRNEPDGSVLMEIQGRSGEIERCLERLRERMGGLIRNESAMSLAVAENELGFEVHR